MPQRFGRYAVMLIMLLTLGVGQMWAGTKTIYLDISSASNWDDASACLKVGDGYSNVSATKISENNLYKFDIDDRVTTSTTLYFKRLDSGCSSTWNEVSCKYSSSYNTYKIPNTSINSVSASYNLTISTVSKTNYIYFNNSVTNWSNTYKYFVIGHDKPTAYSKVYSLSAISNTKLLYVAQSSDDWSDVTYYGFNASNSTYSNGSWGTASYDDASKYVAPYTSKYDMNSGSSYYCVPSAAANNSSFSITYKDGYGSIPKFNAVQAAKKRDTGTSYSDVSGTYPATISLQGTYLSGNGSSSQSTISRTKSSDGTDKSTYGTVVTGKVTHSYSSLSSSYYFEGWGTGSTPSVTTATHTYNISAATTTYAFFSKVYALTYDSKGTKGSSSISVEIANFSGTKTSGSSIPTGHTITFTASPATGYEVEGWYSDPSCTSPYTSGSDGVTISGSGNVTFTLASLNAAQAVYCKFRPKTYSIKLDDNGSYQGDGSATATYFTTTLTSISAPTRTGYHVTGYYTNDATPKYISDASGNLQAGKSGYTDASSRWTKDATATLYAHWDANTYTVTLDKNGGDSDGSITTTYNSSTGSSFSAASRAGYSCDGYFTDEVGGTEIIDKDGNLKTGTVSGWLSSGAWVNDGANITLYAHWTEDLHYFDVTFGVGTGYTSYGSLSAMVTSTSASITSGDDLLSGTGITFTASPNTGYEVAGFYSDAACTISLQSGTTTTYTIASLSADVTVYVKFVEKTWSVAFAAGTGGSVTTPNSTPQTVGQVTGISIAATPSTGYTFNTWTITSGSGSFTLAETVNSNTFKPTSASTITASFNETMHTITISGGTASSTTAGVSTTGSATAAAAAEGKKFVNWTVTSGTGTITLTSGSLTDRTITFHASGTATITANYTDRAYKKVYFAKPSSWTGVKVYAWYSTNDTYRNAAFPGVEITTTETVSGTTYYYYKYYTESNRTGSTVSGNPTYWNRLIFSNKANSDTKTTNLTLANGNYYHIDDGNDADERGGKAAATVSGSTSPADWYVTGYFNGSNDWGYAHPIIISSNTGNTTVGSLTTSTTQYFKIYRASTNQWFKWTGGPSVEYNADKEALIGSEMVMREWNLKTNYFTSTTNEYRFSLDVTNASNPKLTVAPATDTEYSVTVSINSFGHGSTSPTAGSITTLKHYTPTTITANPEAGYRFKQWNKNANVSYAAGYSSTSNPCQFLGTANDGTIEAEFTQDGMIYFDNTMSQWKGDIYVYIFTMDKSTRDPWWNSKDGSGNGPGIVLKKTDGTIMYQYYGKMTRISESNIYYFNYHAAGCSSTIYQVVFTKGDYHESAGLYQTSAAYRSDFNSCFPMYLASQSWTTTNSTGYHSSGYWKRYNVTNSGFSISGLNSDWTTHYEFTAASANSNTFKATVHLSNNTHSFKIFRCSGSELGNNGTMTPSSHSGWEMTPGTNNCQIEAPSGGDYEFTINIGTDHIYLSVEYPLLANDYHLLYVGRITTDGSDSHRHPSQSIRHLTGSNKTQRDTVSFFIDKDHKGTLKLQKCTNPASYGGTGAWADSAAVTVDLSSISETGIYNFEIIQTTKAAGKRTVTAALLDAAHRKYNGELYIRTDMADGGWEAYKEVDNNKLVYSDYAKAHSGYDYYHCHWSSTGTNVHFTIANQYSPSITDTMKQGASPFNFDNLPYQASTRFMYNSATNKISRAYINGSSEEGEATYLWLQGTSAGTSRILNTSGSPFTGNKVKFGDDGNWIYSIDLKAEEAARIKLICNYRFSNTDHLQYFKGTSAAWSNASTAEILGGTSTSSNHLIRVIYDFKTNHLVSAWLADGDNVTTPKAINTSVMVIREHQEDAKQITFTSTGKLTSVDTVYCVMQFNKWTINNKSKDGAHPALSPSLSTHERGLYWVSFPFDVKLNDVFGFGEYGTNWIIEYYDGKGRAENGFWAESPVNWKFVYPSEKATFVLNANEGYVLALDLETMTESSKVWEYVENVSLYFPSSTAVGNIIKKDVSVTIDQTGYECTINRTVDANNNPTGLPADYDRRKRDSYWHCIGVPSFANNTHNIKDDAFIKDASDEYYYPSTWSAANLPFYYKWDPATNAISPYSTGSSLEFKAMNSYLVQYSGTSLSWSSVTTPSASSIVRRKAKMEDIHFAEFKLELMQGEENVDHTFVRLTDNEEATTDFEFGQDLCKEFNKKSNIYTLIGDLQVAGNSMPLEYEKTTLVPVGVKIVADGEYTITMPEGTNGIGVTLIDNELQTRTNLALTDYVVTLPAGDHNERFVLEISPIEQTTTGVDLINGVNGDASLNGEKVTGVSKKLIDGVLYIVKDGKVFDARGARLQ